MANFTSALKVIGTDYHVTLSFFEINGKLPKISTMEGDGYGEVIGVEYWHKPDITVALIESNIVNERHRYYNDNGYTYMYEFKPHFTLEQGDVSDAYDHLIGKKIAIGEEYFRIY